jgi:hypothetical protein
MLAARESDPTPQDATSLLEALGKRFPAATLGHDKCYFIAVSILTMSSSSSLCSHISIGVIALRQPLPRIHPQYLHILDLLAQILNPDSRKALIRRIREAFVKGVSIIGVCKPIEAIILLDAIERPVDKDYSFSHYKCFKYGVLQMAT